MKRVLYTVLAIMFSSVCAHAQYQEEVESGGETQIPKEKTEAGASTGVDKKIEEEELDEEPKLPEPNAAKLMCLNKVTARTSIITAPIGVLTRFGTMEIVVKACKKSEPDKHPDNSVLLELWELKPEKKPEKIFSGWMFSSSPAVSALEHPVYDVTLDSCIHTDTDGM